MKKIHSFIFGLLCGAIFFGGSMVMANSEIPAKFTSQIFYCNSEKIELNAYNINGYNYVKLRDVAKIFDVSIDYDEALNSVYMNNEAKIPTGGIKDVLIDGKPYSREDFSLGANKDIFGDVYTIEGYNAFRQSIADRETILAGNDDTGYNPNYSYAHYIDKEFTFTNPGKTDTALKSVAASLMGYYEYSFGAEPYITNIYAYPGYRICKVKIREHYAPANEATDSFIKSIETLSDNEKVKRIQIYISDKIVYNGKDVAGINKVFTSDTEVNGICGTYADAFIYLCQRADIPCVSVQNSMHAWNEVYADGKWQTVDVSYYDMARTDTMLYHKNYPKTDANPAGTKFAKELLVPSSTK